MRKSQSNENATGRQGEARLGAGCSQDEDMEGCLLSGGAWEVPPRSSLS